MGYLMELCDRNLVVVHSRKFNGAIKTCSIHDVLRELCFKIATKEIFFLNKHGSSNVMLATYKTRRIFTDRFKDTNKAMRMRSLLYHERGANLYGEINTPARSWMLLMVLDLQEYHIDWFPSWIDLLVHLRYLAIWFDDKDLPFNLCNLRCLQTLVIQRKSHKPLLLRNCISVMTNLRHLWTSGRIIFPPIEKPMNLQSVSNIRTWGDGPKSWVKYFPHVKELSCSFERHITYDFKSLNCLEILNVISDLRGISRIQGENIMFPVSLKELTLKGSNLPWICISKIQSLPKLEVLKLLDDAFVGPRWEAGEEPFQKLKFFKLYRLDIKQWEASSINFPCLKELVLEHCNHLEEIPMEIGYIPTLELIKINYCNSSVDQSVYEIQKEQHADGNFDITFDIKKVPMYKSRSMYKSPEMMRFWAFSSSLTIGAGVFGKICHPDVSPAECKHTCSERILDDIALYLGIQSTH